MERSKQQGLSWNELYYRAISSMPGMHRCVYIYIYIYIYLCGFHTRCPYWVSRQPSPRSNYSPSSPMKLMTSQSLPPRTASSVMIMSHRIDLAGLACRKNSLTLNFFLTWNSNQSDKISPPYPPVFHTKQVSYPPTDRSGNGLSADT